MIDASLIYAWYNLVVDFGHDCHGWHGVRHQVHLRLPPLLYCRGRRWHIRDPFSVPGKLQFWSCPIESIACVLVLFGFVTATDRQVYCWPSQGGPEQDYSGSRANGGCEKPYFHGLSHKALQPPLAQLPSFPRWSVQPWVRSRTIGWCSATHSLILDHLSLLHCWCPGPYGILVCAQLAGACRVIATN